MIYKPFTFTTACVFAGLTLAAAPAYSGDASEPSPGAGSSPFTSGTLMTLGPAFAATKVNTPIFRHHSLTSDGGKQFAAYYGPDANIVLADRTLPNGDWTTRSTSWKGNVADAHNSISLGVSPDGVVHMSYDHHGYPLRYRRSKLPLDLATLGSTETMTGVREDRVTYPQFVSLPGDKFLFFYRDGSSGDGHMCVNSYSTTSSAWEPFHRPLITGEGEYNPYWCRPAVGSDGTIHLFYAWRRTSDASTNQKLSYARSRDGGHTWENSHGEPYRLPITIETVEVIDPVGEGNNLSNQDSSEADTQGRPHVVYRKNDTSGILQYFHRWHDGSEWRESQVSSFTEKFDMQGAGTLRDPISRPNLLIDRQDNVYVLYRDARRQGWPRVVKLKPPEYQAVGDWVLLEQDMKQWEPTYDIARWKREEVLDLWLLSSDQGDRETLTDAPPAPARVLELRLVGDIAP